jgi:phage antirepressor YoqD-like protein
MGIFEIVAAEAMEKGTKKERRRSRIEIEKSKTEFVQNLLSANRFTIGEIATYASVSEDFVEKVKKTLN